MALEEIFFFFFFLGAQWLSGRVLDSRPKGRGFEPYRRHCVVSLSKNINPSLVLVQPRKTRPFTTERLLMGRKESNQTKENFSDGQACGWGQSVSQTIPSFMLQLPFLLASLVVVEIELVHSRI